MDLCGALSARRAPGALLAGIVEIAMRKSTISRQNTPRATPGFQQDVLEARL
jgi:hypothetical protein